MEKLSDETASDAEEEEDRKKRLKEKEAIEERERQVRMKEERCEMKGLIYR